MPKPSLLKERRLDPIVPGYFYANVPQLKLYRFCSDIRSLNTFSTLESSCGRKKSKSVHSFQQKKKKSKNARIYFRNAKFWPFGLARQKWHAFGQINWSLKMQLSFSYLLQRQITQMHTKHLLRAVFHVPLSFVPVTSRVLWVPTSHNHRCTHPVSWEDSPPILNSINSAYVVLVLRQ